MKKHKTVKLGGIILAVVVLATGVWYTGRETDDLSIPQIVEYIDTEDGSIVIPQEEVPLAKKPAVKIKKTIRRTVKKTRLKQKAKKTVKKTRRTRKSRTVKKENSRQQVTINTTVLKTVVSATRKNSKVKTVTTTVVTTVKTTTTNKSKGSSSSFTNTAAAAMTGTSDPLQTVSTVSVRSLASRADANVLSAFENLEFRIEINPTSSYSGYFSVKAHNIILKNKSGNTIYHELGHFVGWLAGNVDTSSDFIAIYKKEKSALQSANYQYLTRSSAEYFAESYKDYILSPQNLHATRPQTCEFVKNAVSRITDARVANIMSAYRKVYWS